MDEYAGRVLADRYRLPLLPGDEPEPAETRAFDTYSGQEVLVRQVPLPEVLDAEMVDEHDEGAGPGAGRASGTPAGFPEARRASARTTRSPADPAVRRAMEAAQSAAQIPDHPRLDQVFDVFAEGGSLWVVSELVEATPLAAMLAERPLNPYRAAEIASDVLTALRVLHAHGWTHRNITARTVLVCDDGRVVLTGLAAGAAEEALCGYDPVPAPELAPPVPGESPVPGSPAVAGPPAAYAAGGGDGSGAGQADGTPDGPDGPATSGGSWAGNGWDGDSWAGEDAARAAERAYPAGQVPSGGQVLPAGPALPPGYTQDQQPGQPGGRMYDQLRDDPQAPGQQPGPPAPRDGGSSAGDVRAARAGAIAAYRAGARAAAHVSGDETGRDEPEGGTGGLPVQRSAPGPARPVRQEPGGFWHGAQPRSGAGDGMRADDLRGAHDREAQERVARDREAQERVARDREAQDRIARDREAYARNPQARNARAGTTQARNARAASAQDPDIYDRMAQARDLYDRSAQAGYVYDRTVHEPEATGPDTAGPDAAGPHAPGSHAPGSHAPGSEASGSHAPGPHAPGPYPAGPDAPGPYTSGLHAPGPYAPGPDAQGRGAPRGSSRPRAVAVPDGWDQASAGRAAAVRRGPQTPLAAERARQARITVVGAVTERWAPEQAGPVHSNWQLAAPVGPATDLWALGVLLFRAVQGHGPYPEESAAELVQLVCAEPPAFAEECGPLRPVVESLLRQDPTERPDIEELRGWLRSLVRSAPEPDAGQGIVPVPPADATRLPIVRRRGELVRRRRRSAAGDGAHGRHRQQRKGGRRRDPVVPAGPARPVHPAQPLHSVAAGPYERSAPAGQQTRPEAKPRSLGRTLLVVILVVLVAALVYALKFMPKTGDSQQGGTGAPAPVPAGSASDEHGSQRPGGAGKSQQPQAPRSPQGTEPDSGGPAAGYAVRKDPEGFQVAVDKDWERRPVNDAGQVRYLGGDFELVVVPGRDSVKDEGADPMAYQRNKERELKPFRDSTWSSASGLRRIDVGKQAMAEGQFTWQDSSGREVYVRNVAMIIAGRYHIVQVIGPEAQRDKVTEIYEQAVATYRTVK